MQQIAAQFALRSDDYDEPPMPPEQRLLMAILHVAHLDLYRMSTDFRGRLDERDRDKRQASVQAAAWFAQPGDPRRFGSLAYVARNLHLSIAQVRRLASRRPEAK